MRTRFLICFYIHQQFRYDIRVIKIEKNISFNVNCICCCPFFLVPFQDTGHIVIMMNAFGEVEENVQRKMSNDVYACSKQLESACLRLFYIHRDDFLMAKSMPGYLNCLRQTEFTFLFSGCYFVINIEF